MVRVTVPRVALTAVLAAGLAGAGCSSWYYEKPGVTRVEAVLDFEECKRTATRVSVRSIPTLSGDESVTVPEERMSRSRFNRCMEERGYSMRWE